MLGGGVLSPAGARRGAGLLAIAVLVATAVLVAGCGSSKHFANTGRPPAPVDLTVYVNEHHVSVSPAHVGAGPAVIFVTNDTTQGEDVTIRRIGGASAGSTGTINSGMPAQILVNLRTGDYAIGPSSSSASATLHVGKSRPSADNALLQP